MVDGKKMAKRDGNFITLQDGVNKWGADACRCGLSPTVHHSDALQRSSDIQSSCMLRGLVRVGSTGIRYVGVVLVRKCNRMCLRRLALSISGDSLDDANFETNGPDNYILR